jgi:tRNA(Arg) A34 adenosine deaminase TadA
MRNNTARKFMRLAIRKAREGILSGQTPFGACIVKNGKIVSCAHNIVWGSTDITAHGEINAIRQACKKLKTIDLSGCTIYATCEPCPMCLSACHWAKISKIVFGASIADAKKAGFNELIIATAAMKRLGKSNVRLAGGLLKEECKRLFDLWKAQGKGRAY